jgi:hypothetical protein
LIIVSRGEDEPSILLETQLNTVDAAVLVHSGKVSVQGTRRSRNGDTVRLWSCQPAVVDVPILIATGCQ